MKKIFVFIYKYLILIKEAYSLKDKIIIFIGLPNFILERIFKRKKFYNLLGNVTIKNNDGIFYCGKNIHDIVRAASFFEKNIKNFLKLKPYGTFVDIGANIGKYTIMMGRNLNRGKVISIEPEPNNFKILKKNVKLNKLNNVHLINAACFSKEGKIKFYIAGGHSSIYKKSKKWIFVKTKKLDNILKELKIRKVDLIKIDVEGAEAEVLKGAKETLKKYHPKIIFEAWDENYLERVKEVLRPFNYKIKKIDDANYFAYLIKKFR